MNKKYIYLSILLLAAFLFPVGCKKKTTPLLNLHTNYFGLTPGRYVIYEVQEMSHDINLNPKHDTISYQLKTVIGEEIIDDQGRKVREFKRYKRNNSSNNWVLSDLWTAYINASKAELVEENQRKIKLVFAPTPEKTWNPNAFNSLDSLKYYYSNIHKPLSYDEISFDSTLTVKQDEFHSLIDYKVQTEIYATKIGLISKTFKDLIIENFDTLNVRKGTEIHYKCIEYGFE